MGYLDGQDYDKSENRVCVNGFKILNIEKIIFATAKIIFSMQSALHGYINGNSRISGFRETDNHVDFGNFLKIGGTNFDFLGSNPLLSGSRQNSLTDYPGERLCVMSKLHH